MTDKVKNSKHKPGVPKGSRHSNTFLKEHHIVEIRHKIKVEGQSVSSVAQEYGISIAACSKIYRGITWSHITERSGNSVIHKEEYHIWNSMKQRCTNVRHAGYPEYGGRGIKLCDEWFDFEKFLRDMGKRPSKGHSLDRIDPNGNYEPSNVRWATGKVQARNKRNSIYLPHPTTGEMVPAGDIADELGIPYRKFRKQMIDAGKWPKIPERLDNDEYTR